MGENNTQTFPDTWDTITKINFLQRKILLNSILYYEYDKNALSDNFYDDLCKQLVELQMTYSMVGDIKNDTRYGYVYYDFDGTTGYHLYRRLSGSDQTHMQHITLTYLDKH